MTTFSLAPMHYAKLRGLESVPIDHAPEDASETFKSGALLVINGSTGEIAECGADPTAVQGVSMVAASGVAATDVILIKPYKGVIFEASLENSGSPGYALAQTDLYQQYGAIKDGSTGYWYVDQAETTTKVFEIVGFKDAVGDIRARVYVEFALVAME